MKAHWLAYHLVPQGKQCGQIILLFLLILSQHNGTSPEEYNMMMILGLDLPGGNGSYEA